MAGDTFHIQARETLEKLRQAEWTWSSSPESAKQYLVDHEVRFRETLALCKQLVPEPDARVLDVGQSYFTKLLSDYYRQVCTIGLDPSIDVGGHRSTETDARDLKHIQYDLNNSAHPESWPLVMGGFDLIVYAETIEHLTIAPEYSMMCLAGLLSPKGILLMTTPNAATFSKRVKIFLGKNPFEMIRLLGNNPGHFREYTLAELSSIAARCNLRVVYAKRKNFYSHNSLLRKVIKNLHPSFRDSLVMGLSLLSAPNPGNDIRSH
jgi:2-polyprenyl-3-methyl-5-hydroxy-6-metoxy-1,4-benzoquinol methylase